MTRPKRTSSAKPSGVSHACAPAQEQIHCVVLPGTLSQRDNQWWWNVQLPDEDKPTARPLTPSDAEAPTEDLEMAQRLALEMWERALTVVVERRVRANSNETAAKLKARFLEKVRDYSQIVETTKARLEAEIQARTEAEAKLAALVRQPEETILCECCETSGVPAASATRIDSGQLLCPDCLAALQAEISRIDSEVLADCNA